MWSGKKKKQNKEQKKKQQEQEKISVTGVHTIEDCIAQSPNYGVQWITSNIIVMQTKDYFHVCLFSRVDGGGLRTFLCDPMHTLCSSGYTLSGISRIQIHGLRPVCTPSQKKLF